MRGAEASKSGPAPSASPGASPGASSAPGGSSAPPLGPGLWIVATPIGAARDITLRALDVLASAEVLAAEDTRTLRRLMEIHGIPLLGRRILAYHDRNGAAARPGLLAALADGKSVALVSDAGTPLVADPGHTLVREAAAAGHEVHAVPGASAVLAALTVAGLPTDRFLFAGFLPSQSGARRRMLEELRDVPATLVFFEAPHRLSAGIRELLGVLGEDRRACICRELTKRFEEVRRGTLGDLAAGLDDMTTKGELVLVVDRGTPDRPDAADVDTALRDALSGASVKDAAKAVSDRLGLPRRDVYQRALSLSAEGPDGRDG